MSTNKNSSTITAVVIVVVVVALGYFLFKSSPDQPQRGQSAETTNVTDSMHGGPAVAATSDALNALVGKPIPDIQLSDANGKLFTVADFKGKNTVFFFNEGLMCYPACWNQIASFGSDARFNSDTVQALSVVTDSAKDWQRAIAQMPQLAKATTMFDTGASASRQLGMLSTASSMHRGSLPGHTYVLVDKDGIVRYVLDDPNMAIANDLLFGKIGELQ